MSPRGCATNSNRGPMAACATTAEAFGAAMARPVAPGGAWLSGQPRYACGYGATLRFFLARRGLLPDAAHHCAIVVATDPDHPGGRRRAHFYWAAAVAWTQAQLEGANWLQLLWGWLHHFGVDNLPVMLAPLLVLMLAIPIIVIVCVLVVAVLMAPSIVSLVASGASNNWSASAAAPCSSACCGRLAPPWRRSWPWCFPCRCGWFRPGAGAAAADLGLADLSGDGL